jgi:acyl-CoA dehydrogenase
MSDAAVRELPDGHPLAGLPRTPEGRAALVAAHHLAVDVLRPAGYAYDRNPFSDGGPFCWPVLSAAAEAGIYTPEFFTVLATDPLAAAAVAEELCWGDPGLGLATLYAALPLTALVGAGTPMQIAQYAPLMFGTAQAPQVGTFVASEPGAGSDLTSITTTAVRDGDHWILNGVKRWGGNTGISSIYLVLASVAPELGARGQALFAIEPGLAGMSFGEPMRKLGMRATVQADLFLQDVRIPVENILGGVERMEKRLAAAREGKASRSQPAFAAFTMTRPLVGAMAVGIARASLEYAAGYAATREVFGRPVAAHGAAAVVLADAATQTEAARALVHAAMRAASSPGGDVRGLGSMAKLAAGRAAVQVSDAAIQILGGIGYTDAHPVERWHRDSKVMTIFEGTDQVQQTLISRALTGIRVQ